MLCQFCENRNPNRQSVSKKIRENEVWSSNWTQKLLLSNFIGLHHQELKFLPAPVTQLFRFVCEMFEKFCSWKQETIFKNLDNANWKVRFIINFDFKSYTQLSFWIRSNSIQFFPVAGYSAMRELKSMSKFNFVFMRMSFFSKFCCEWTKTSYRQPTCLMSFYLWHEK